MDDHWFHPFWWPPQGEKVFDDWNLQSGGTRAREERRFYCSGEEKKRWIGEAEKKKIRTYVSNGSGR